MDVGLERYGEFIDIEIFQLEFDKINNKVVLFGSKGLYWVLGDKGVIVLVKEFGVNLWFEFEWYGK